MKCHYEVLNVDRDADDADIKTAYRKLALKWHPDKNLENSELAKEQFQIVQQAYEVLSDRQERAWYDNHREQILRGSNSDFEDNSLDVFQFFTATCFRGYGDDDNGFYTIYRNVFEKLAREDMDFMDDKEEFCKIPNFGNCNTDFRDISGFYAYWLNYTTKKSFVWLDPYNIKDIKERRYLKLVEKENKKVRQKAKKERNEEIRNLVAFVKKRDKRVQAQKKIQDQKLLEDKKKRETISKQKKIERQEELTKARVSGQPEWSKFENVKSELEQIERHLAEEFGKFSDSEDDEDLDNLYCVACSKLFKTPKAFQNHESSKKHRENMEILKGTMLQEESESDTDSTEESEVTNLEDYEKDTEIYDQDLEVNDNLDELYKEVNGEQSDSDEGISKNKKKKKKSNIVNLEGGSHSTLDFEVSSDDFEFDSTKSQKKKSKKNKTKTNDAKVVNSEEIEVVSKETPICKGKKDKKKRKCIINEIPEIDLNHNCVTCKSSFSSKNKLFDHLKKTGHGIYIPPNVKNKNKNDIKSK